MTLLYEAVFFRREQNEMPIGKGEEKGSEWSTADFGSPTANLRKKDQEASGTVSSPSRCLSHHHALTR